MDSTHHIALRRLNSTMNGMHTNRYRVGLIFCAWMPAVMRDSWIRGYKSQKISPKQFRTGFFLVALPIMAMPLNLLSTWVQPG
eukprot:1157554-Pelagomonas_calceolata.AAC.2